MPKALMFQGTGSSVGKSVLVAGIARALTNRGFRVRPFKPQNMSNNAAVTADGGEIGRAQALQAQACRVETNIHMNPVLLKPQSETGSQIIVQGKRWGKAKARDYQNLKPQLFPYLLQSFEILSKDADIILIEGAGSASEINLRAHDIANMGFAQAVQVPVMLIGDIDRGGVIASLVGTHTVLDESDRSLIKGFLVNKMRGDLSLFTDTMSWIAQKTGWRDLGLIPYFPDLRNLPAEDTVDLMAHFQRNQSEKLQIVIPLLPTIANFDDFDPLKQEQNIQLHFIPIGKPLPLWADVILLPGSKSTIADLKALYAAGWDIDLRAHYRKGGYILGICGGYQMLGREIIDLHGIEGQIETVTGLGLLNISTVLEKEKYLTQVKGHLTFNNAAFTGYEMHLGQTKIDDSLRPFAFFDDRRCEGCISSDSRIIGTYLHGLFHCGEARHALLALFGAKGNNRNHDEIVDKTLGQWAEHLERWLSIEDMIALASEIKKPPEKFSRG